jgi:outer membrane protein TolC
VTALRQQEASLKVTIDQQIRSAMLDVHSSNELVKVAQSNVELSKQVLADATDRFKAGVDDNLPVVQAQATLANAQTQLVQTLYQYNQSKLTLARNTGVVETQYKDYLGR